LENTGPLEAGAASLWRAPAHATRRAYPGPLRGGPAITGEIAAGFPIPRDRGDAPPGGVGRSRTDRQLQEGRGRRHDLSAVALERLRGRWAGPVEVGFAFGSLRTPCRRNASALRVPGGLRALVEIGSAYSQLREPLRGARVVVLSAVHGRG